MQAPVLQVHPSEVRYLSVRRPLLMIGTFIYGTFIYGFFKLSICGCEAELNLFLSFLLHFYGSCFASDLWQMLAYILLLLLCCPQKSR